MYVFSTTVTTDCIQNKQQIPTKRKRLDITRVSCAHRSTSESPQHKTSEYITTLCFQYENDDAEAVTLQHGSTNSAVTKDNDNQVWAYSSTVPGQEESRTGTLVRMRLLMVVEVNAYPEHTSTQQICIKPANSPGEGNQNMHKSLQT